MGEATYQYWLPDSSGNRENHKTLANSVIIIGANGSGKSKIGAWIEQQNFEKVHRIASQRNLNFSKHIPLKSYSEAENTVFYGSANPTDYHRKEPRWNYRQAYTTTLLNDFDSVLAALLARYGNETQTYYESCRKAEREGAEKPTTQDSTLEKLYAIWTSVFPQREIKMVDASFLSSMPNTSTEYPAPEMSDGERAVLYLAAQVLCVPEDKVLIIDEPEIHLHPSLTSRLWRALEQARPDCLFIYITHDVQFAVEHAGSDVVWVKAYDGSTWDWSFVPDSELPEELVISLAGNRKPVLFVEGNKGSYDLRLYTLLYPDFNVVPCGSCKEVIHNTKAYNSTKGLNSIRAYGIVDRDHRTEGQLAELRKRGTHALGVAEIENVFLTEPVVKAMAKQFLTDSPEDAFAKVKDYIIDDRFKPQLGKQINAATISSLRAALSAVDITPEDGATVTESFKEAIKAISPSDYFDKQRRKFEDAANGRDYEQILALFNDKGLAKSIGHFLGINDREYCERACRLMEANNDGQLRAELDRYVPQLQTS